MHCWKVQSARGRDQESSETQTSVVRLEVKKGTFTETQCHKTGCLVIVLEGAWRVHLAGRAVTVSENEMLHIPAGHEHFLEALADTVGLSVSDSVHEWTECAPLVYEDPDQYLWGV
jgi:quercetin dioxygenase-like cupin family protein